VRSSRSGRAARGEGAILVPSALCTFLLLAGWGASPVHSAGADPLFLPAKAQGGWTAPDKQLHFAGSLAIASSLRVTGRNEAESLAEAAGVGILKEIYDVTLKPKRYGRGASLRDLVADLLGAAAGAYLVSALE
jgi:VanZ family protein